MRTLALVQISLSESGQGDASYLEVKSGREGQSGAQTTSADDGGDAHQLDPLHRSHHETPSELALCVEWGHTVVFCRRRWRTTGWSKSTLLRLLSC